MLVQDVKYHFAQSQHQTSTITLLNFTLFAFLFSIIFDRLADGGKSYQQATSAHLSNYSEDGLRTLALAYRTLEPAEYEKWNSIFTKAKTTIGPEREELLEAASEMIEKDMILLGAAAVEDKLQKGVSLFPVLDTLFLSVNDVLLIY